MNTAYIFTDGDYPVILDQRDNGRFRVRYGAETHDQLKYGAAAEQFGLCVFHSLACAGKIDSED